jgi:hypothetical protein
MKYLFALLFTTQCIVSIGQVVLSEMQSSNSFTIADNMGEFDDWIEIHNPTADSLEIGGLILKDQLDTWSIPTGDPSTFIPPNGYFLLWADDQEDQGIFHTNFKLASGGEFLGLYESDGITVIDSITLPALSPDNSYVRCNTGWLQTSDPTPLAENNCTANLTENKSFEDLFSIKTINDKQLEINVVNHIEEQRTLSIYSIDGKEVIQKPLDGKKTTLDLTHLDSKVYILSISTSISTYSKKIVLP